MGQAIAAGGDADHAPHQDEPRPLQQPLQGGDQEGDENQANRPEADLVNGLGNRARAKVAERQRHRDIGAGYEERHENRGLERRESAAVVEPGALLAGPHAVSI
jgi:hypothetical protein